MLITKVRKKSGNLQDWDPDKIINAVKKSADRICTKLTDSEKELLIETVEGRVALESFEDDIIPVEIVHSIVEGALDEIRPDVARSYKDYRNWVKRNAEQMKKIYEDSQAILNRGDSSNDDAVSNANADASLCSTKGAKMRDYLLTAQYEEYFLNAKEKEAAADGYIYIHDKNLREITMNCCLFDIDAVLKGGFEMGNMWYNEPKRLSTAFDVIGDITLSAASQQYGGFTIPRVDHILDSYAEYSYNRYKQEYEEIAGKTEGADEYAEKKVIKDFEQGFQGWEYKFNTVASSRGDYPFITVTFGLQNTRWGKECCKAILRVRKNGQGKEGFKKPVLFPKLVFLYDENLHGKGCEMEDVFETGIECSSKTMYPDWLSLTGEGYVAEMYKKYGEVVSPMGCRAFLSPYYREGGIEKASENDSPVFEGRFNIGVVSLNLPMILAKARHEDRDFYEVLDFYLEMIRKLHLRTYDYLGNMKASLNPLGFCQGGFYGGHLGLNDKIAPVLDSATASFGITALNELQELYNGKSIVEDGAFAHEVMEYINQKINEFKEADHRLYAIYGTPAESLCLSGDTEVQCYGGNKQIKDIKVGDIVYSYNIERKCIELKPVVWSGLTKRSARVVKVTMDNGQEVICTPNHPFAVRTMRHNYSKKVNGFYPEVVSYTPAVMLKPGDRIKSNYFFMDEHVGRMSSSIYGENRRRQLVQDIHAEYVFGLKPEGYVVHHKNENKNDNSFENLEYMSGKEHRIHHMNETISSYQFKSDDVKGENNPFYGKHHSEESNAKNRLAHIGQSIERFLPTGEHVGHFDCADDAEKAGFTRNLVVLACRGERTVEQGQHFYHKSYWYYTEDCREKMEPNHKVVSVEYLDEEIDVYDITVEDNHNFFVGGDNGMLVHNCSRQVKQFRKKYGVVTNVSDRLYVSNSFHCHVSEKITPIEKQDKEKRYWDQFNGGKIQYCRYNLGYNIEAIRTLVRRAMKMGFYEGVNMSLAYCDDCGHEEMEMDVCPICGSKNLTKIDRMNGYLAYSRVHGDTRLNAGKMAEIKDRISM